MKRTTITFADDLADGIERYRHSQDPAPDLTSVVNAAVCQYLVERGYLPAKRALRLMPADHGSGFHDISVEHNRYFAGQDD